jgi:hypothetical protein
MPAVVKRVPGVRALRARLAPPAWPVERLPVAPPEVPEGWATGAPDFVGIGAQRAGTSWWHTVVSAHPEVHVHPGIPKEIHHFDRIDDAWSDEDVAAYHALFPRPPGTISGEWTPEYMVWPWCPPRLAAAGVPRLLVTLRDPVDRYRSGWSFSVRRGAPAVPTIAGDAFHRGLYHRQLRWVLEHFDRSQLLVLQYEACLADPVEHLQRTYRFLDVDPSFEPEGLTDRARPAHASAPLDADLRRVLTEAYAPDLLALLADFPEIDPALWPTAGALG